MTQRAEQLMNEVWTERNTWADTEQKLVAAILRKMITHVRTYTASSINNLQVIDTSDLLTLSKEIEKL